MTVLIAAGPFSTSDNLSFEPLADLVKHIRKDKPDVVILVLSLLRLCLKLAQYKAFLSLILTS